MSKKELKELSEKGKRDLIRYSKSFALIVMVFGVLHLGLPVPNEVLRVEQLAGLGTLALLFVVHLEWLKEQA